MKLTKQQLKQIIKEEMSSVISEKAPSSQDWESLAIKHLENISRDNDERKKAFKKLAIFLRRAKKAFIEYLPKLKAKGFKPWLQRKYTEENTVITPKSDKINSLFLGAFVDSHSNKVQEAEGSINALYKWGLDLMDDNHQFFVKPDSPSQEEEGSKPSQEEEGSERTADTDRLLNVLDKVNDEWDQIQNSTKDKKLKVSMDYLEKVALAEANTKQSMKLTKQQLKQIIKEEMSSLLESSVPQEAKEKIFAKMKKNQQVPEGDTIEDAKFWEVNQGDYGYESAVEIEGKRYYGEI